jgi:excisionase family DNA binding protein
MSQLILSDTFTLEEAAAYLKISPQSVLRQATQGNLPGRKVDNDWRFLKSAIDSWLKPSSDRFSVRESNSSMAPDMSRVRLLQQAGAFADDDSLAELRDAIYQARGRAEVDECLE